MKKIMWYLAIAIVLLCFYALISHAASGTSYFDIIHANNANFTNALPIASGGTGANTIAGAQTNLGWPNVPVPIGQGGTGSTTVAGALTNLGLTPTSLTTVVATNYSGSDIGAQVNAAIAALSNGGTIIIPAGVYSFSTTIQLPTTGSVSYLIEGEGTPSILNGNGQTGGTTELDYTGSTDAINDMHTDTHAQKGSEIKDIFLNGTGTAGTVGIHIGQVIHFIVDNVMISDFENGIEVESNSANRFAERTTITNTALDNNTINGILFNNSGSATGSFAYSHIDINCKIKTPTGTQACIKLKGTSASDIAWLYNSYIRITGNIDSTATSPSGYLIYTGGYSTLQANVISLHAECNLTSGNYCGRLGVVTNSTVEDNQFEEALLSFSGHWENVNLGGTYSGNVVSCTVGSAPQAPTLMGSSYGAGCGQ